MACSFSFLLLLLLLLLQPPSKAAKKAACALAHGVAWCEVQKGAMNAACAVALRKEVYKKGIDGRCCFTRSTWKLVCFEKGLRMLRWFSSCFSKLKSRGTMTCFCLHIFRSTTPCQSERTTNSCPLGSRRIPNPKTCYSCASSLLSLPTFSFRIVLLYMICSMSWAFCSIQLLMRHRASSIENLRAAHV